jgi:hypothetical protein
MSVESTLRQVFDLNRRIPNYGEFRDLLPAEFEKRYGEGLPKTLLRDKYDDVIHSAVIPSGE